MPAPQRDRRPDGRPEQVRPRDRTGRPLPRDTREASLVEDHDPATVEEALELGIGLWNAQRYFEAHECLEHVWHAAPQGDADLWQGVIQIAVAGVHLQRGNPAGAATLLRRAGDRLQQYPDGHRGIEVDAARAFCADARERIAAGAPAEIRLPDFPRSASGAWFAPDTQTDTDTETRPTTSTPIPDEPAWLSAGRRRRPQIRGSA